MTTDQYQRATELMTERARPECSRESAARLREECIVECLPLAEHIARRFSGRGEPYDDLLQVARLGLIQAIDRFDPGAGHDFLSFAVPTVMGEVRRHFRDRAPVLRVPRGSRDLHDKVLAVREELAQERSCMPTTTDIAERLGAEPGQVRKAIDDCRAGAAISLDQCRSVDDEAGPAVIDRLGDVDPGYRRVDDSLELGEALGDLGRRERRILGLRFVRLMSQSEIADEIGISQMHVSRLLRRTLNHLRRVLEPLPAAA
ncbi:SigB/SigF/SigG family RNA polymerase sigma factor [Gordonia sp. PP30]|uniref:SigB/SigF/SigG family RNA polymerase sigma factor n=1 Tax=unclassified Gordonia (in: high G+C Gram-positive bacteria) TaxID=2657482 RepID=UPI001FFEACC7|nr:MULTISPECIES: SigB/SigF/SigG family RNA polymerase sigma factor [unclassified Gordonia (in: high G+C Gram-positive bacteria)]UQE76309.1 SigB/SigF/SigG family RNA polymerase sigma factor [Gordonia sp. PP30]